MKNLFWGDVEEIIKVDINIPDKNLYILKNLYPNSEIIKETSRQINNSQLEKEIVTEKPIIKTIKTSYETNYQANDQTSYQANYSMAA